MAAAAAVTGSPVRCSTAAYALDAKVVQIGRRQLAPGASIAVSLPAQPVLVAARRVS